MTIKEAAEILRQHNEWRRWDGDWCEGPSQPDPHLVGLAIDVVVRYVEGCNESNHLLRWWVCAYWLAHGQFARMACGGLRDGLRVSGGAHVRAGSSRMNRIKAQRRWDPAEIAELKRLTREGVPYAEIAARLNRTEPAIGSAVYQFMPIPTRKPWRLHEIAQVRHMAGNGVSDRVIGLTVGRSRTSVSQMRERHGIAPGHPEKTGRPKA